MRAKNWYIFILLMFFTLVYMLPLGVRPLFVPDETRYAEIPREMIQSGDWVVPELNGLKYFEKPIMGYWVHALAQKAFGETNFAVRLPSGLATGLVALTMFMLLASVTGREDSRVYLAPLIFLSSFGIFGIGTIAILDNLLNLFLTASIALFFLATEKERGSGGERLLLVLAGLAVGCAFMTKGFLAFVVPVITVFPYLIWQKRLKEIFRLLLPPALAAVVISLPWSIMIHLRDPDFWNFFFWHEHVRRFFADDAQHTEPFWFYLANIVPLYLPWILFVPSAFSGLISETGRLPAVSRLLGLCICWVVFPFLFFSLSSGKLVTYILPCLAPLAILTACGLWAAAREKKRVMGVGLFFLLLLIATILSGLIASQALIHNLVPFPEALRPYEADLMQYREGLLKPGLIIGALGVMLGFCILALFRKKGENRLVLVALSPLLVMALTPFAVPDHTLKVKAPGLLFQRQADEIAADAMVVADKRTVNAANWYLKREDIYLITGPGELRYGLEREPHRLLGYHKVVEMVERKEPLILLLWGGHWQDISFAFPEPKEVISSDHSGYVIVKF